MMRLPRLADLLPDKLLDWTGNLYVSAGLAYCAYLTLIPEALRARASSDGSRFWKRTAVGAVLVVGIYEMIHAERNMSESESLERQIRAIKKQHPDLLAGSWQTPPQP